MDLWDHFDEILQNEDVDAAELFYRRNRAEMDLGCKVSWPAMRPLLQLMKLRAQNPTAFEREHQHNPMAAEGCPFSGELKFWVHVVRSWIYFGAHDPSMGKKGKRGDPSASLVGGFDRDRGILAVVEAIVARRTPDKQLADIIRLQKDYHCLLWLVESVAFQEFFRQQLVKESAKQLIHVPARGFEGGDKDLRIESLQPHVSNGLILFHRNHKTLNQQLEYWPQADHDDGPDALEMLWQAATRGLTTIRMPGGARRRRSESSTLLQGH
jgi:predicted phage terminase large subunit-like protein